MSVLNYARLGLFTAQKSFGSLGTVCVSTPFLNLEPCTTGALLGGVRFKFSKKVNPKVQSKTPGGIQYEGFKYFPRFPNQEDPPIEPTKLFMVKRIRSLYGCPHWEKKWILQLNLVTRRTVAIVKNTPSMNAKLYRIKHLVEITPIKTPQGLPDSPENGFLKENGEFISYNLLSTHGDLTVEDAQKGYEDYSKKNLNDKVVRNRLHHRWYSRFDVV